MLDLNEKIGKDGKLTAAERACCFANNLCLVCGVGHTVKECPRTSSSATKANGRAAKAQPKTKSDSTPAEDAKKIESSLLISAQTLGCIDPNCAIREVRLNASTPFKSDALFLPVTTSLLPSTIVFKALIDSGSTHCFVNSRFISKNNLLTYSVPLIQLRLFDGCSNNVITQAIDVPL